MVGFAYGFAVFHGYHLRSLLSLAGTISCSNDSRKTRKWLPFKQSKLYHLAPFDGSPSILGIAEFIVPTGSFFYAQIYVSFHIIEELSPKVRMIPFDAVKIGGSGIR